VNAGKYPFYSILKKGSDSTGFFLYISEEKEEKRWSRTILFEEREKERGREEGWSR